MSTTIYIEPETRDGEGENAPSSHAAVNRGRPQASATVWRWQGSDAPDPQTQRTASAHELRRRGVLKAALPAAIGGVLYAYVTPTGGTIVIGIAAVLLISAVFSPRGVYAVLEGLLDTIALRFTQLVSWLVVRALFYGVFFPFGRILRGAKNDRLDRRFEPTRSTYWKDRRTDRTASGDRRKQF